MPSVFIVIQQNDNAGRNPGSRDDLVLTTPVVLTNSNDTGVITWLWQLVDKPEGSSATLTTPTQSISGFTPDVVGTYLIQLTVNGTFSSTAGAAIKTTQLAYRIPAAKETEEFDTVRGWGSAVDYALQKLDDGYGSLNSAITTDVVHNSRQILAGYGLIGGGNLSADRSFALDVSGVAAAQYNIGNGSITFDAYGRATNAVQATNIASTSRLINTTSGQLTGGGDLSADRTLGLAAFGTAGSYNSITTDAYGRVSSGSTISYTLQSVYNASAGASPSILLTGVNGPFTIQDDGTFSGTQLFDVLASNSSRIFGVSDQGINLNTTVSANMSNGGIVAIQDNVAPLLSITDSGVTPIGTLLKVAGSGNSPLYFSVDPSQTTIANTLVVDGYTINPVNATSGQALMYDGTAFVPTVVVLPSRNVNTTAPLSGGGSLATDLTLAIPQANVSTDGYLSQTDWNTFNNKQPAGNYALQATTINTTAPLTGGGDLSTNRTLSIPQADATHDGYLSQTDWSTFNSKLSSAVTSVATDSTLTGGTITSTGTLGINLSNANTWSAQQTFSSHIVVDGYTIDASGGATSGQVLEYNGTSFVPTTPSGGGLTGSIANNQVAFGSGTSITGSNSLQYDGTNLALASGDMYFDTNHYVCFNGNDIFWQIGRNVASLTPPHTYTKTLVSSNSLDILLPGDGEGFTIGAGAISNVSVFEVRDDGYTYMLGPVGIGATPDPSIPLSINGHIKFDGYVFNASGATSGDALVYNGTAFVPQAAATPYTVSFSQAHATTNSSSHLTNGDHIQFDSSPFGNSAPIVLDTSTSYTTTAGAASIGRFTLTGGKTYRMVANAGVITTSDAGPTNVQLLYQWYDATNNIALGQTGIGYSPGSGVYSPCSDATAYFGPGSDTLVEVRIISQVGTITGIGDAGLVFPWAMIETIS